MLFSRFVFKINVYKIFIVSEWFILYVCFNILHYHCSLLTGCGLPSEVPYSVPEVDDTTEGSTVQYTCIDSYMFLTDDMSISCSNGEWFGDVVCAAGAYFFYIFFYIPAIL